MNSSIPTIRSKARRSSARFAEEIRFDALPRVFTKARRPIVRYLTEATAEI